MMFFPLYIDPGTGSMLFSIVIGAAATLFFLAKAVFLKLKLLLAGKMVFRKINLTKNMLFTVRINVTGLYSSLYLKNSKSEKLN